MSRRAGVNHKRLKWFEKPPPPPKLEVNNDVMMMMGQVPPAINILKDNNSEVRGSRSAELGVTKGMEEGKKEVEGKTGMIDELPSSPGPISPPRRANEGPSTAALASVADEDYNQEEEEEEVWTDLLSIPSPTPSTATLCLTEISSCGGNTEGAGGGQLLEVGEEEVGKKMRADDDDNLSKDLTPTTAAEEDDDGKTKGVVEKKRKRSRRQRNPDEVVTDAERALTLSRIKTEPPEQDNGEEKKKKKKGPDEKKRQRSRHRRNPDEIRTQRALTILMIKTEPLEEDDGGLSDVSSGGVSYYDPERRAQRVQSPFDEEGHGWEWDETAGDAPLIRPSQYGWDGIGPMTSRKDRLTPPPTPPPPPPSSPPPGDELPFENDDDENVGEDGVVIMMEELINNNGQVNNNEGSTSVSALAAIATNYNANEEEEEEVEKTRADDNPSKDLTPTITAATDEDDGKTKGVDKKRKRSHDDDDVVLAERAPVTLFDDDDDDGVSEVSCGGISDYFLGNKSLVEVTPPPSREAPGGGVEEQQQVPSGGTTGSSSSSGGAAHPPAPIITDLFHLFLLQPAGSVCAEGSYEGIYASAAAKAEVVVATRVKKGRGWRGGAAGFQNIPPGVVRPSLLFAEVLGVGRNPQNRDELQFYYASTRPEAVQEGSAALTPLQFQVIAPFRGVNCAVGKKNKGGGGGDGDELARSEPLRYGVDGASSSNGLQLLPLITTEMVDGVAHTTILSKYRRHKGLLKRAKEMRHLFPEGAFPEKKEVAVAAGGGPSTSSTSIKKRAGTTKGIRAKKKRAATKGLLRGGMTSPPATASTYDLVHHAAGRQLGALFSQRSAAIKAIEKFASSRPKGKGRQKKKTEEEPQSSNNLIMLTSSPSVPSAHVGGGGMASVPPPPVQPPKRGRGRPPRQKDPKKK